MKKGKGYLLFIFAAALLAAAVSWVVARLTYAPAYRTEAVLVIGATETEEDLSARLNAAAGIGDAFAELLNSSLMERTILQELGLERFEGIILAERIPETNIVDLKVTSSDPQTAYEVICALLASHTAVTEQVMGMVPITVLQAPVLPQVPVNTPDFAVRIGTAVRYAVLIAAVLCLWYAWSKKWAGMDMGVDNSQQLDLPKLLADILKEAKQLWATGIGLMLACAVGFCSYQYASYQPVYEMSASFTIRLAEETHDRFPSRTTEQLAETMPKILSGDVLLHRIMEYLDLTEEPEVLTSVSSGSKIMTLTVRSQIPEYTQEVLSAILSCYPEVAEYVVGPTKLILLELSGPPEEPSNPLSFWMQIRNGFAFGIGLWLMAAMLQVLSRLTVHNAEELSQLLQCSCLGESGDLSSMDAVSCRKILLITSALPGEGKSTIAWDLAKSAAQQGKRVLLAECNPQNPALAQTQCLRGKCGMSEYLTGQAQLRDIVSRTKIRNLYAVSWGTGIGNRGPQSRSRGAKLLAAAEKLFDCVILDGPCHSRLKDIADIAESADGVILVVRKNWTTQEQITEAKNQLQQMGIPVVGSILNGADR